MRIELRIIGRTNCMRGCLSDRSASRLLSFVVGSILEHVDSDNADRFIFVCEENMTQFQVPYSVNMCMSRGYCNGALAYLRTPVRSSAHLIPHRGGPGELRINAGLMCHRGP